MTFDIPNSTDFNLSAIRSRAIHKLSSDIELLKEYKKNLGSYESDSALQELLFRHNGLFRKLAWKMSARHSQIASFEDFMQHAYVGAIIAYNRFDEEKAAAQNTKLSTYVHRTIEHHLLTAIDLDAPIYCPTQQRSMRSYLGGKYNNDPEKKQKFEAKKGIHTEEDRDRAKEMFKVLKQDMISLDVTYGELTHAENPSPLLDVLSDNSTESQLINRLDIGSQISQLSLRQQAICDLIMQQEFTTKEAANMLGVTEGVVRGELRTIRDRMNTIHLREMNELRSLGLN